ncbi:MAG TPA: hypothetical protein VGK26_06190 [Thermoanaerobaculia bacterium]|jgi:hypothetical protein
MLLALVFSIQATTAASSAAAASNPCMDQMSELCKISALFCPSAYPSDLTPGARGVPCWPEANAPTVSRDTRVVSRPSGASASTQSAHTESARTAPASSSATPNAESPTRGQHLFGKLFSSLFEGR